MFQAGASVAALVEHAVATGLGSAAAVAMGVGDDTRVHHVVGHTQRVPRRGAQISSRTRFDLASLTKPIATTTVAMTLASEGLLDLDAPIRRWLDGAAAEAGATVAQLLGHAAGCVAHGRFFDAITGGDLAGERTPRAALVAHAARTPLAQAPGVAPIYSDVGYILLGALLERVGGASLEALLDRSVNEPLGTSLRFGPIDAVDVVATELDDAPPPRDAEHNAMDGRTGRRGLVVGRVHDENAGAGGGVAGHAGLFGSLDDVAAFARAMIALGRGTRFGAISPAVFTRFATTAPAPGTRRLGWDTPSTELGVSHAGDAWPRTRALGHTGFTGTSVWLDLDVGRWVVLLTNRIHPSRDHTLEAIRSLRRAVGDAAIATLD